MVKISSILIIFATENKGTDKCKERKRENFMLNKQDLVTIIAEQEETTKKDAARIVDAFIKGVKTVMKNNESVSLVGFGKFVSEYKEARKRVLGFSGETIEVPAHYAHKAKLSAKIAE